MDIKYVSTICPYCGCGCGIYLVVKDSTIIGVEPWREHPVNEGANCPKGKNAFDFLYGDGRLTKPLVKEDGIFKESSWEEALALIAEKLKKTDSNSVGFINSGKLTNEDLYVMQKFVRCVIKTNNLDNASRFCHSTTVPALISTVGSGVMSTSELSVEKADCIFLAGSNIKENYPLLARRMIRAREGGAKVIVTDLRRTLTAKTLADIHLQLNPGADTALVNAMMKTILDEGLEDGEFIEKRTSGFEDLRNYLASLDMNDLEGITGVSAGAVKEAARIYAKAKTGCIIYNAGIAQGFGDMGPIPVFYPGFKPVNEESVKLFEGYWGVEGLPSAPGKTYMDMVEKCSVLYVAGANPMISAPDTNNVRKALEDKELLVVQDIFMTETAELADIVLPAASWVEKDGTITELDRRVQRIGKAIEPPGEAKPDWKIICELAALTGMKEKFDFSSPEEIFEEIRKTVPQYAGITYERLKKAGGIQWPCPKEDHPGTDTMFVERFATPDGLGHFQVVSYKPPAELPDEDYPYVFSNGRIIFHYHSGSMTRRTERLDNEINKAIVEVNTEDAWEEGIKTGDEIILKSRRGEIEALASPTDDIRKGVVFMPWHFSESSPNVLTGPSAGPPSKMPEFKFCAVKMEVKE